MPFCFSPWSNLDISPTGDLLPCCKFQQSAGEQKFNIQTESITEYKNSEFLNTIKEQFKNNKWPSGCSRCQIEEENNVLSKRQLDWQRWQSHYENFKLEHSGFITASLAFGNTCNLKCITCSSKSSSHWREESLSLFGKTIGHFKFYKNDFVQDFVANALDIVHLDIPGGEPFLSGINEQKELLQYYINSGKANRISLHYTTNATIYPGPEWWELWKHFKEIDMQLSIDGVNDHYEYIRYPAKWDVVVRHIVKYLKQQDALPNFRLSVSHTLSAYNIYYLDEFFTWCYNIKLPTPWVGRVHTPDYMRPDVWPEPVKSAIVNKLQQSAFTEVRLWAEFLLNNDSSQHFETFKYWTNRHDEYRGLNFVNTFSEMGKWVK